MRTTNSARVRAASGDRSNGAGSRNSSLSGVDSNSISRTRDIVSLVAGSGEFKKEDLERLARSGGRNRDADSQNGNGFSRGNRDGNARGDNRGNSRGDRARGDNRGAANVQGRDRARERDRDGAGYRGRDDRKPAVHPAQADSPAASFVRERPNQAGGERSGASGRGRSQGADRSRANDRSRAPARHGGAAALSGGGRSSGGRSSIALPSDGKQRIVREKGKKGGCVKEIIDPARFVKKAVVVEKAEYAPTHGFNDFGLNERILKNVEAKGYVRPSPIQDKSIGLVMEGKDVVGIANTGTGKTAAFALPMIHKLIHDMEAKALILAPTRELAQQIQEEIISFSKNCGIRTVLIIGGNSINVQTRDLAKNPRVVIGTPGRLKDHINQGTLDLSGMTYTVLDEVDRMLDMGFIRDIRSIFSHVPKQRQSVFFSATIDKEVERLILDFAKDPVTVSLRENVTADGVDQDVVWYDDNADRIEKLHDLLIKGCEKTIIFDDTKRAVEKLGKELNKRGFRVDQIHGDKSQGQRTRAIRRLKADEIDVLVATDVAARGIDVSDITHVINYSQPVTYEDYVHRIGRTGRAGKTGKAFTFLQKGM